MAFKVPWDPLTWIRVPFIPSSVIIRIVKLTRIAIDPSKRSNMFTEVIDIEAALGIRRHVFQIALDLQLLVPLLLGDHSLLRPELEVSCSDILPRVTGHDFGVLHHQLVLQLLGCCHVSCCVVFGLSCVSWLYSACWRLCALERREFWQVVDLAVNVVWKTLQCHALTLTALGKLVCASWIRELHKYVVMVVLDIECGHRGITSRKAILPSTILVDLLLRQELLSKRPSLVIVHVEVGSHWLSKNLVYNLSVIIDWVNAWLAVVDRKVVLWLVIRDVIRLRLLHGFILSHILVSVRCNWPFLVWNKHRLSAVLFRRRAWVADATTLYF